MSNGIAGALARSWRERVGYLRLRMLLSRHGLGGYLRRGARVDAEVGARLRRAASEAGVTYIALGRLLSVRRDIVPAAIAEELTRLGSDGVPMSWPDVEAVLRDSLGGPVEQVFAAVDRTPLAVSLIGQVHCARLCDGAPVVVKVLRPGVRAQVERDLPVLRRLARRVPGGVDVAERLSASLREELDYTVELANMRAVAAADAGSTAVIPVPYPALSSTNILVMQRLSGTPIGAAGPYLALLDADTRTRAARALLETALRQILIAGVFHANLHPNNVLVDDDGTLGLLDFAAVGRLDEAERRVIADLLAVPDKSDPIAAFGTEGRFPEQVARAFRTLAGVERTLLLLDPSFDFVAAARLGALRGQGENRE
ncbi:ABC1 kinase family protein [Nocardia panacis]|uniref:ABC1 kinase family protein n=1 Tax=Nocardia panacis TaxID=2340916 RepID=UPI0013155F36|nr:AarF/UbiB family protein [Nocardia panacis]